MKCPRNDVEDALVIFNPPMNEVGIPNIVKLVEFTLERLGLVKVYRSE